jgi:hypothetical protein
MRVVIAFCLVMAPFALVHAQLEVIGDAPPPVDEAALRAQLEQIETDFNAAQAKAARSGDDKMSCDQIHAELVTVIQSPGFQQVVRQQQAAMAGLAGSSGLAGLLGMAGKSLGSFGQVAAAAASSVGNAIGAAGTAQGAGAAAAKATPTQAGLAGAAQSGLQVAQAAINSPEAMRAAHLGQLAESKGCKFQIENPLAPH